MFMLSPLLSFKLRHLIFEPLNTFYEFERQLRYHISMSNVIKYELSRAAELIRTTTTIP